MIRPTITGNRWAEEFGAGVVVVMVLLLGLLAVAGVAVSSITSSLKASSSARYHSIAFSAAESGVAAGMDYARRSFDPTTFWSALVSPANTAPMFPDGIVGNRRQPGDPGNPFSTTYLAWFEVSLLNNPSDLGFALGVDRDARLVIRSVGHGPDRSMVILEVEVSGGALTLSNNCGAYGQEGQSEAGAGRNDCLGLVGDTGAEADPGGL